MRPTNHQRRSTAEVQHDLSASIQLMRKDARVPRHVVFKFEIAVLKCLYQHSTTSFRHVHDRYLQRRAAVCGG